MSKDYESELDTLVASSLSESRAPLQGGYSLVSELTSSQRDDNNLSAAFGAENKADFNQKFNVGELLSSVTKKIIEEDNKLCRIKLIANMCDGDVSSICGKKRAGGKNTFCIKRDCDIEYRNEGTTSIDIDSIVIERVKNVGFISPMGSCEYANAEILKEWTSQEGTLAEWADRFLLAESTNVEDSTREDLKVIKDFSEKAAAHKTPFKAPRVKCNLQPFQPHDREKFVKSTKGLKDGGFGMTSLDYFERVDNQFVHLEDTLNKVTTEMNINNEEIFATLKMLEVEKNKLKIEVGNCKDVIIEDDFDAA